MLIEYGLSGYKSQFCSYLTYRHSSVRNVDTIWSPYVLQSVPQRSLVGPLLVNIFLNDLCNIIKYSICLLFAVDTKIFRCVNSAEDCTLLQSDIEVTKGWCATNLTKLNISDTRIFTCLQKQMFFISFIKYVTLLFPVRIPSKTLWYNLILNCIFTHYNFSDTVNMSGFVLTTSFSFFTLDSLLILYLTLVGPKHEYP